MLRLVERGVLWFLLSFFIYEVVTTREFKKLGGRYTYQQAEHDKDMTRMEIDKLREQVLELIRRKAILKGRVDMLTSPVTNNDQKEVQLSGQD